MAMNAARAILKPNTTGLLVCDVQEAFAKALYEFENVVKNQDRFMKALRLLNIPMLVTEQNPKSLGKTISELDISGAKGPFAKTTFSMCTPEISKEIATLCNGNRPEALAIIGGETHVCVENTVIDLRKDGYEVHVVADCVTSRSQEDRLLALERMKQIGCHIATSENILYKLMGTCEHPKFRDVLKLVKPMTIETGLAPLPKL